MCVATSPVPVNHVQMFVQPQPDPKAEVSTWVSCHDREGKDGASRVLSFLLASGSCGQVPAGFFLPRASR